MQRLQPIRRRTPIGTWIENTTRKRSRRSSRIRWTRTRIWAPVYKIHLSTSPFFSFIFLIISQNQVMIMTLTLCLRWFGLMPSYLLLGMKNWEDNTWNCDCVTDENATRLPQQLLTLLSSIWHVNLLAQSGMNQDQQSRLRKNDIYNSILLYPVHQGAAYTSGTKKRRKSRCRRRQWSIILSTDLFTFNMHSK